MSNTNDKAERELGQTKAMQCKYSCFKSVIETAQAFQSLPACHFTPGKSFGIWTWFSVDMGLLASSSSPASLDAMPPMDILGIHPESAYPHPDRTDFLGSSEIPLLVLVVG